MPEPYRNKLKNDEYTKSLNASIWSLLTAGLFFLIPSVAAADEFGLSPEAARIVKGYIQNDDLDAAAQFLARNPDAMLAESGPATRQALDTAMQAGGEALAIGRKNVDARFQAGATRFNRRINDLFGEARGGIVGRAKDIAKKSAPAREAAYRAAYAQPRPMTGAQRPNDQ